MYRNKIRTDFSLSMIQLLLCMYATVGLDINYTFNIDEASRL